MAADQGLTAEALDGAAGLTAWLPSAGSRITSSGVVAARLLRRVRSKAASWCVCG